MAYSHTSFKAVFPTEERAKQAMKLIYDNGSLRQNGCIVIGWASFTDIVGELQDLGAKGCAEHCSDGTATDEQRMECFTPESTEEFGVLVSYPGVDEWCKTHGVN